MSGRVFKFSLFLSLSAISIAAPQSDKQWVVGDVTYICPENTEVVRDQQGEVWCYIEGFGPKPTPPPTPSPFVDTYDPNAPLNVFIPEFNSIGGEIIDVSTRGNEVWVVKRSETLWRYKGNKWKQIPGFANQVSASVDGWTWIVDRDRQVSRYNPTTETWQVVGRSIKQVSAYNKDIAVAVDTNGAVYKFNPAATRWNQLPYGVWRGLPLGAAWASVDKNNIVQACGPWSWIWEFYNDRNKWWSQYGACTTIDTLNPTRKVVTDKYKRVFVYSVQQKGWKRVPGREGIRGSINEGVLITLNSNGFLEALAI